MEDRPGEGAEYLRSAGRLRRGGKKRSKRLLSAGEAFSEPGWLLGKKHLTPSKIIDEGKGIHHPERHSFSGKKKNIAKRRNDPHFFEGKGRTRS